MFSVFTLQTTPYTWRFIRINYWLGLRDWQKVHFFKDRKITILGDPGAASRDDGIFMGESVNFRPWKSRRPD